MTSEERVKLIKEIKDVANNLLKKLHEKHLNLLTLCTPFKEFVEGVFTNSFSISKEIELRKSYDNATDINKDAFLKFLFGKTTSTKTVIDGLKEAFITFFEQPIQDMSKITVKKVTYHIKLSSALRSFVEQSMYLAYYNSKSNDYKNFLRQIGKTLGISFDGLKQPANISPHIFGTAIDLHVQSIQVIYLDTRYNKDYVYELTTKTDFFEYFIPAAFTKIANEKLARQQKTTFEHLVVYRPKKDSEPFHYQLTEDYIKHYEEQFKISYISSAMNKINQYSPQTFSNVFNYLYVLNDTNARNVFNEFNTYIKKWEYDKDSEITELLNTLKILVDKLAPEGASNKSPTGQQNNQSTIGTIGGYEPPKRFLQEYLETYPYSNVLIYEHQNSKISNIFMLLAHETFQTSLAQGLNQLKNKVDAKLKEITGIEYLATYNYVELLAFLTFYTNSLATTYNISDVFSFKEEKNAIRIGILPPLGKQHKFSNVHLPGITIAISLGTAQNGLLNVNECKSPTVEQMLNYFKSLNGYPYSKPNGNTRLNFSIYTFVKDCAEKQATLAKDALITSLGYIVVQEFSAVESLFIELLQTIKSKLGDKIKNLPEDHRAYYLTGFFIAYLSGQFETVLKELNSAKRKDAYFFKDIYDGKITGLKSFQEQMARLEKIFRDARNYMENRSRIIGAERTKWQKIVSDLEEQVKKIDKNNLSIYSNALDYIEKSTVPLNSERLFEVLPITIKYELALDMLSYIMSYEVWTRLKFFGLLYYFYDFLNTSEMKPPTPPTAKDLVSPDMLEDYLKTLKELQNKINELENRQREAERKKAEEEEERKKKLTERINNLITILKETTFTEGGSGRSTWDIF